MTFRDDLQPTPQCIPPERTGEPLSEREREHVAECPRCEAELALWNSFETAPSTGATEEADVAWVVERLRTRFAPAPRVIRPAPGRFTMRTVRPVLAIAAAALLIVSVGYLALDPSPRIRSGPMQNGVYRSLTLRLIEPIGDLAEPPREFSWLAIPDAVDYDVQVLEIDRTVLWRTSSTSTRVVLPRELVAQLVPGKTVLWNVTARSATGAAIASSDTQRFRVSVTRP